MNQSAALQVAVTGAAGRMGRALIQAIDADPALQLSGALERPGSDLLGTDAGLLAGIGPRQVLLSDDRAAVCAASDLLIDFSVPQATLALLPECRAHRCKLVIGTTGFDAAGQSAITALATQQAVLKAPNMSVGVNLLFHLVQVAAQALGDSVDVEVLEAHHRHKADAPSGTAVRLGEVLAETLGRNLATDAVYGREGITGPRSRQTIGFATVRAGDIVGDHTVLFAGAGERLELTHRAHSRENFAEGALRGVHFLRQQPVGLFSMEDVLGFN